MLIQDYPKGSDITLLNTTYRYPRKNDQGKYSDGCMDIIYRDNTTGEKKLEHITNPDYLYYKTKPDVQTEHWNFYLPLDDLEAQLVPFKDLEKALCDETNNTEWFFDNIRNGNRKANKQIHSLFNFMSSDMNIEDHYRLRFSQEYPNNIYPISKGYIDIEVDTYGLSHDFPEPGECPINAISYINMSNNTVYSFLLRNPRNPLIEEFEEQVKNGNIKEELHEFITNSVGGEKEMYRKGLSKLKYVIRFYDEEIRLIHDAFRAINHFKTDFVLAWNMSFDIPYIIARLETLGYSPEEVMCHPDFPEKYLKYYVDTFNENEYEERGDYCSIASYTVFLDQMIQFASRRKGQSNFISYSLDYIGENVAGVNKTDYSHITSNLTELPYLNYQLFVFYNIMDTVVQACIEAETGDIEYVFSKCLSNNTRYSKCHRQTVYLYNRGVYEFWKDGLIMGNNINRYKDKSTEKYDGAFVGDPAKLTDFAKMDVNGKPVYLFDNLNDYDYARLYPSITMEDNIGINTQIGKISILGKAFHEENHMGIDKYSREMQYTEDLHSRNFITFCHRWFNYPDYKQMYRNIKTYFTTIKNPSGPLKLHNSDGTKEPAYMVMVDKPRQVIRTVDPDSMRRVVIFNNTFSDESKEELRELMKGRDVNETTNPRRLAGIV